MQVSLETRVYETFSAFWGWLGVAGVNAIFILMVNSRISSVSVKHTRWQRAQQTISGWVCIANGKWEYSSH